MHIIMSDASSDFRKCEMSFMSLGFAVSSVFVMKEPAIWGYRLFFETGSLHGPGCACTAYVDQLFQAHRDLPASISQVLGLETCSTIQGFILRFSVLQPVLNDMGVGARLTQSVLPFLVNLSFEAHFSYEIIVEVVIPQTLGCDCETPHTLVLEVLLNYFLA